MAIHAVWLVYAGGVARHAGHKQFNILMLYVSVVSTHVSCHVSVNYNVAHAHDLPGRSMLPAQQAGAGAHALGHMAPVSTQSLGGSS